LGGTPGLLLSPAELALKQDNKQHELETDSVKQQFIKKQYLQILFSDDFSAFYKIAISHSDKIQSWSQVPGLKRGFP